MNRFATYQVIGWASMVAAISEDLMPRFHCRHFETPAILRQQPWWNVASFR
jgi:hypothetical protein